MDDAPLLGPRETLFVGLYLASLVLIGYAGRRAKKEDTLADFYLGGRSMGIPVLFLTLYATQYSGNTLIGYAGSAYRSGYAFLVSVPFMMGIIGAYMVFAPRLHRLSRIYEFITPGDYIQHRFGCRALTLLATCLCIFALANYILSNLKAIGYLVEGATGGRVSFAGGILALSLIMVVYETLGGMRSVAWTDVIQGLLLLAGCAVIFAAIEVLYGGLSGAAERLLQSRPEFWEAPDGAGKRLWLSTLAIVFFGVSVYPQAIQRIYAARSEGALRRAFQMMVFMPLFTTFFIVVIGLVGAARFPGLDRDGSEGVVLLLLNDLAGRAPAMGFLIVVFLSAVVAAIMSTVDSALLAISSLFTQDLYRPLRPEATQRHLTASGKRFSWAIIALMAYLAMVLPQTIWRLTEIKLELLCQVAPAFFLGVQVRALRAPAVLAGLVVGTVFTLALMGAAFAGAPVSTRPLGVHAGVWGLGVNLLTVAGVSLLGRAQPAACQVALDESRP